MLTDSKKRNPLLNAVKLALMVEKIANDPRNGWRWYKPGSSLPEPQSTDQSLDKKHQPVGWTGQLLNLPQYSELSMMLQDKTIDYRQARWLGL